MKKNSIQNFASDSLFFIDKFWEAPILGRPSSMAKSKFGAGLALSVGIATGTTAYFLGAITGTIIDSVIAGTLLTYIGELGMLIHDEGKARKNLPVDKLYSANDAKYLLKNQLDHELNIDVQREVYRELLKENPGINPTDFLKGYQSVPSKAHEARKNERVIQIGMNQMPSPQTLNDLVQSTRINIAYRI